MQLGTAVARVQAQQALKDSEMALREAHKNLERKVHDRTAELTRANENLQKEISERLLAKEALEESERRLMDIIDFLPDATFVIDNEGRVIAWNHAMEEMTGVSKKDMMGQGDHAYTVPFYCKRRRQLLDLLDADEGEIHSNYQYVERKGDILYAEAFTPVLYGGRGAYVWAMGAPIFDAQGNRVGAIESIRDITDRKRSEEALLKAKGDAEVAARSKSEFLATMSHEIRTSLNAVIGMTSLLLEDGLTPEQKDCVETIRSSGDALLAVINDILDLSKIERDKVALEFQPFNLRESLRFNSPYPIQV